MWTGWGFGRGKLCDAVYHESRSILWESELNCLLFNWWGSENIGSTEQLDEVFVTSFMKAPLLLLKLNKLILRHKAELSEHCCIGIYVTYPMLFIVGTVLFLGDWLFPSSFISCLHRHMLIVILWVTFFFCTITSQNSTVTSCALCEICSEFKQLVCSDVWRHFCF